MDTSRPSFKFSPADFIVCARIWGQLVLSVLPLSMATFLDAILLLFFCITLYSILGLNLYGLGAPPPHPHASRPDPRLPSLPPSLSLPQLRSCGWRDLQPSVSESGACAARPSRPRACACSPSPRIRRRINLNARHGRAHEIREGAGSVLR